MHRMRKSHTSSENRITINTSSENKCAINATSKLFFQQYLAKTQKNSNGDCLPGRNVLEHTIIVGIVAKELINYFINDYTKKLFPSGVELIAACHDIGKISPSFQYKLYNNCHNNINSSNTKNNDNNDSSKFDEKNNACFAGRATILHKLKTHQEDAERENKDWGGHAGVSQITIRDIYYEDSNIFHNRKNADHISFIVGKHHGKSPKLLEKGFRSIDEKFGGELWHQERKKLVSFLQQSLKTNFPDLVSDLLNVVEKDQITYVANVVAGLTSVADWIGSSDEFNLAVINDSYTKNDIDNIELETPNDVNNIAVNEMNGINDCINYLPSLELYSNWHTQVIKAIQNAGFIKPIIKQNLSFQGIFNFSPRDIQQKLIEAVVSPGVYVLEAPMGEGKTEAALYAAYKMLAKGFANGMYFALPTQMTANKIHERIEVFLQKILSNAEEFNRRNALLLHANAWLNNKYQSDFGVEGQFNNSWFDQAKRGLLAPFAVGTIDQALLSILNVKHSFVRTFGLVGKVVILDELHSYDMYTGTLIQELIKQLQIIGCTVIILSATLTLAKRQEVFDSLISEDIKSLKNNLSSDLNLTSSDAHLTSQAILTNNDYPLISALPYKQAYQEYSVDVFQHADIKINLIFDDIKKETSVTQNEKAIAEALHRAEQGELVLWIENTVKDAQKIFTKIASRAREIDVEPGLLHSRFIFQDRELCEEKWVNYYSKEGRKKLHKNGCILVGTQILEQSLDIDADFLITRLAPTDMLLQRIGRLWRHKDSVRSLSAVREAWILTPVLEKVYASSKYWHSSAMIYEPYILCRTLEVWHNITQIVLPKDIRALIDNTYYDRDDGCEELGNMQSYKRDLINKCKKLKNLALSASSIGATNTRDDSDEVLYTRYSEIDYVRVLLLKQIIRDTKDNPFVKLVLLNDEELLLPKKVAPLDKIKRRDIVSKLEKMIVKVSKAHAPKEFDIDWLSDYMYVKTKNNNGGIDFLLRAAIVNKCGKLESIANDGSIIHDKYELKYSARLGYVVIDYNS